MSTFLKKWSRSSHPEVFLVKVVQKICSKFTVEHPCQKIISIKLLQQRYWNHTSGWVLSCKFAAFFRTPFTKNTSRWLLLIIPNMARFVEKSHNEIFNFRRTPPEMFLEKRCSENLQQIYRKTPIPKCGWNHTSAWVFINSCVFSEYIFLKTPPEVCFWILAWFQLINHTFIINVTYWTR